MKDIHPLCSRKRSLSRIVSSPSYRLRQENYPPQPAAAKKKKEDASIQKYQYLVKKRRSGDNKSLKDRMATLKEKRKMAKVREQDDVEQEVDESKENRVPLALQENSRALKNVNVCEKQVQSSFLRKSAMKEALARIVVPSPSYQVRLQHKKSKILYTSPKTILETRASYEPVTKTPSTPKYGPQQQEEEATTEVSCRTPHRGLKTPTTPSYHPQRVMKTPKTPKVLYRSPERILKTPTSYEPKRVTKTPSTPKVAPTPTRTPLRILKTPTAYKPQRVVKTPSTPLQVATDLPTRHTPRPPRRVVIKTPPPTTPSFKPQRVSKAPTPYRALQNKSNISQRSSLKGTDKKRRHTLVPPSQVEEKDNSMCNFSQMASPEYTSTMIKPSGKDRRRTTVPQWKPNEDKVAGGQDGKGLMTPWKNSGLNMRERLDLWLTSKGKSLTPCHQKFKKSPHPRRHSLKPSSHITKVNEDYTPSKIVEFMGHSSKCLSAEETTSDVSKDLQAVMEKIENNVERCEIESDLEELVKKYTTIVKFAAYWICRARLASLDDDVQRVICLLEQAHAFQAHPGVLIKEEICRYLEILEHHENNSDIDEEDEKALTEEKDKLVALYAITPGRRVHFAVKESPIEFKSYVIRFCLLESKAFKRKLNAQLKRKVMTPVRRSFRIERSEMPNFLRNDDRVITGSPGELEDDIVDGEVTFVPNTLLDTPLNKGWLIQDECNNIEVDGDDENAELSFMGC